MLAVRVGAKALSDVSAPPVMGTGAIRRPSETVKFAGALQTRQALMVASALNSSALNNKRVGCWRYCSGAA